MFKDYYKILEVSSDTPKEGIKKSYRRLLKKWHPDKNSTPQASSKTQDIIEAYLILSDSVKKLKYDIEYRNYFSSASSEQTGQEYTINDEDLNSSMNAASYKASQILNKTIKDIIRITSSGLLESFKFVKLFLIYSAIIFLIGLLVIPYCINEDISEDDKVQIENLNSLLVFTSDDSFVNYNIPAFGKFSLPSYLEKNKGNL